MKKLVLLSVAAGVSAVAFGQRAAVQSFQSAPVNVAQAHVAAKTTAVGDTFITPLFTTADTFAFYYADNVAPHDSGFIHGTNAYGDKGFAQRYDVKASDSTVKVVGVYSLFGGTVSPSSSNTVDLNVWKQGAKTTWGRPTLFNSGFPGTILATKTVNVRNLGIGMTPTESDSFKINWFASATPLITENFFVGFTMNYTWGSIPGDTLGLYHSKQGNRTAVGYTPFSTSDTTINNYNATMYADGTWHDNFQDNFHLYNKLYIRPIVVIYPASTGVAITNNDFTFHGNYPNPATSATNISFALAAKTDVTIQVMDLNGRILNTISKTGLSAGENTITVETANLAAGEYVYVINTANGGGIASKFTVIK
jgi:hypothetical protein